MADNNLIERMSKMHEAALAKRRSGSAMVSFRPAEVIDLAFDMVIEFERLGAERNSLRHKVRAGALSDRQLSEEMAEMQRAFSNRGEHGGSPGEWSYERMGEVATEQQRRATRTAKGTSE